MKIIFAILLSLSICVACEPSMTARAQGRGHAYGHEKHGENHGMEMRNFVHEEHHVIVRPHVTYYAPSYQYYDGYPYYYHYGYPYSYPSSQFSITLGLHHHRHYRGIVITRFHRGRGYHRRVYAHIRRER
jgi:hypothetical protein